MRFLVVVSQQLSAGDADLVECGWERVVSHTIDLGDVICEDLNRIGNGVS